MLYKNVSQLIRIFAIILLSYVSVSCGSGDGKDPINASPEDVASGTLALIFEDDFGGPATAVTQASKSPLPIDNWRVETGYGPDNDGNGNDEWQLYQNSIDNLYTENGSLVISAQCSTAPACGKRDDSITSARITSQNRLNVKYGNVQARIKMPSGLGMWPAFWMLGSDFPGLAWPDAGEIDIVEMHYFFSDIQTTHFATHWAGPRYAPGEAPVCASGVGALSPDEQENCATSDEPLPKTFDFPLTDDFHIFELEWTDKVIIGKIDGITYFTQGIDPATMEEFQKDYFLLLNVAVGGTLGGEFGPQMTAADWADPNQTNMLVDWVRVYENVPASTGTLIAESGKNLDFNRIINSAEIGGAFVESDLDSTAVEALVGNEVLSLIYSTSVSENGGVQAGFAAALFDFNRIDLSSFTTFVFSINTVDFPNFDDFFVKFEDSGIGAVEVHLSTLTPIAINGDWTTYEIPLSDFAGVDLKDITIIGFFNPVDSSDTLIAGTLYIDDIRFETEECTANGSVAFDSINYNPDTSVASVSVDDICAASSLAVVKVETGTDEIVVGVNLDAAGQGETIFNLVKSDSVCSTDDELSLIKLSSPLMATYTRTFVDTDGTQHVTTATATAGIDPSAPGTTIVGEKLFIYATDPAQTLSFVPEIDFFFSDFGTGSQFNGDFTTDTTFSPVFSVSNSANTIAVLALFNFTPGFAANAVSINFKVKDMPNNFIEVSFGDPKTSFPVDLLTYSGSTFIGDGWFEVSIPMTEFPDVGDNTFVQFSSNNLSPVAFTYLITDIFLQESAGDVPAECDDVILPPVAGSGTGATGATGGPYSVSFDDSAVTYGFIGFGAPDTITALNADPVDGTNMVAVTTKPVGAQVWAGVTVETVPGITWPLTATNNQLTIRIYAPGAGVTVLMKLEDSANEANFAEAQAVTTVDTGWETLTFTFVNPPAFTYDKLSLFFGFGTVGDGTAYTWDTIEFVGGASGGELITNGGFETGDLSGWTQGGSGGTFSADDTQDSGSTWTAHVVAGVAENPSLSQTNLAMGSVMPGDTIDISFDLCGSAADGGEIAIALLSEFGVGLGADRNELIRLANPPSVWTRYSYSPAAGVNVDGGVSLQFDVICGGASTCSADVYLDNVSVTVGGGTAPGTASGQSCAGGGGGPTEPVVAAPTPPSRNAADVKSLFSDAYSDVVIDTWLTVWSSAILDETFVVDGSATKLYTALDFVGIEFMNPQIDASAMTHFHVDIWTPDATSGGEVFRVKLVDFGAATTEHEIVFDSTTTPALATGAWVSLDIPLSDFTNLAGTANLGQLIFSGTLGGGPGLGTVYVDNVYFYNSAGASGGELAVNGDFETGDLSGWTEFPGGGTITADNTQNNTLGGAWSGKLAASAGQDVIVKQANLAGISIGDTVDVSFDLYGSQSGISGVVFGQFFTELSTGGASADYFISPGQDGTPLTPTTTWTTYSRSITIATDVSGGVTLQLKAGCGAVVGCTVDAYFDNVTIVKQ